MKKDLVTHIIFLASLFILISLYKRWISLVYFPFWLGGILGNFLPDIDYLVYAYLIRPKDQFSKEITSLASQKQVFGVWDLSAKVERNLPNLLFHKASFQMIFVVFALLLVTSSGLLGRGLGLAFLLHLLVDELVDLIENKNLDRWFEGFPISLDSGQKRLYVFVNGVILLIFGFLL